MMKILIYVLLLIKVVLSNLNEDFNIASNNYVKSNKTSDVVTEDAVSTLSSNSSKIATESEKKEVVAINTEEVTENVKLNQSVSIQENSNTRALFRVSECPTGFGRADNHECVPVEE